MRCFFFIEERDIRLRAPTHQTHSEEAQKDVGHPVIWPTTTIFLVLQLRFRLGSTYNFTQNMLISVCSSLPGPECLDTRSFLATTNTFVATSGQRRIRSWAQQTLLTKHIFIRVHFLSANFCECPILDLMTHMYCGFTHD